MFFKPAYSLKILINDSSHLFTVLVVVVFTKKLKETHKQKDRAASRVNTQPSSKYFHKHFLLRRVEINNMNIIRVVKYEYDEYTLNFEYE